MRKNHLLRRTIALLCCALLGLSAAGCKGGKNVVSSQPSSFGESADTNVDFPEEKPNPPVRIPAAPEKPAVDEAALSPYGRPAPKWMRDSEMYTEYSTSGLTEEEDIREWDSYFSFLMGAPWDSATTSVYTDMGLRSASYFDPYHVFSNEDIAVMDADGNFVQSDYIEPGRNDLYVVCHNCPEVTFPWAHAYIDKAMSFGAAGMFFDDIRAPYASIAKDYNTCYSTKHEHTLSGTNTENYFGSTLKDIYEYVKTKNPQNYVVLNGGMPLVTDKADPSTVEKLWPFADALMWEHAIYDSNTKKWTSWPMLKQAAERLAPGIANGKVEMLLSYSYEKMSKDLALEAAIYTIAYCRMYDLCWGDYHSLYKSSMDRELVKELYGVKTGPAGSFGVFCGTVSDEASGVRLSGVTVEAGGQKTLTDDNGCFSITLPAKQITVKLSREGYETAEQRVSGYQDNLTLKKTGEGTVYYVASYGSNDNDGKSADKPWRSLNYGDAKKLLKPGDTVVVAAGQYSVPNETNYNCSGTTEAPITYIADGEVTIRTAAGEGVPFRLNGSYMLWDGFRFQGSETGVKSLMQINGEGCHIRNCVFSDTAFYNAENKLDAESAVTIRGKGTKFHHNVLGSDLYTPVAVLVEESGDILLAHNTFDGTLASGGKAAAAVKLASSKQTDTIKNNVFNSFGQAFANGSAGAQFGGNLFYECENGDSGCVGDKDISGKAPGFMWQATGDYDLRRDGAAVNAGVDAGFAFRGQAPDIGAFESAVNAACEPKTTDGVIYRTFAGSVVLINTTKSTKTVTIPLGKGGAVLREVGYGKTCTADGSGNLQVTIPADEARILQIAR